MLTIKRLITVAGTGLLLMLWSTAYFSLSLQAAEASSRSRLGKESSSPSTRSDTAKNLSEGYAILQDLMRQEARVRGVLAIRTLTPESKSILNAIAVAAEDLLEDLASFAKQDTSLLGQDRGLPTVEKLVRDAIAGEVTRSILYGNQERFRKELLLSQIQATEYTRYLLTSLAELETNAERRALLKNKSLVWKTLRQRLLRTFEISPQNHHENNRSRS
jgi:hypothetical protein